MGKRSVCWRFLSLPQHRRCGRKKGCIEQRYAIPDPPSCARSRPPAGPLSAAPVGGRRLISGSSAGALALLLFMVPVTVVMHTGWLQDLPADSPEYMADMINVGGARSQFCLLGKMHSTHGATRVGRGSAPVGVAACTHEAARAEGRVQGWDGLCECRRTECRPY